MSWLFTSDGQSIGTSASGSVLPMNIKFISFRFDWLDLLAIQRTLRSFFQHYSLEAFILQCSAFFMVQLLVRLKNPPLILIAAPTVSTA